MEQPLKYSDLISPDDVAVMVNGRIAVTGGPELVKKIDEKGYEWIKTELGIPVEKEDSSVGSIGVCVTRKALTE